MTKEEDNNQTMIKVSIMKTSMTMMTRRKRLGKRLGNRSGGKREWREGGMEGWTDHQERPPKVEPDEDMYPAIQAPKAAGFLVWMKTVPGPVYYRIDRSWGKVSNI